MSKSRTGRRKSAPCARTYETLQAHLNLTPVREQQLQEVTRDYDNAKTQYQSLLQKESQSELATNLEKRQLGEQFRVIDPASLPEKPVQPNALEFVLGGWLVGLVVGIGLTALKQITDTRLYGERDVRKVTPLSLLVSIPNLPSPGRESALRRHHLIEAVTASVLLVSSLGLTAYFYFLGELNMYTSFFSLTRNPFEISPDPHFFVPTAAHNEALAGLHYGIRAHKGFMVLTGEVGTGKTLVVRCLLDLLDQQKLAVSRIFFAASFPAMNS